MVKQKLKTNLDANKVDTLAKTIASGFARMDKGFAEVDNRFGEMDRRFGEVDRRLGEMNKGFVGVHQEIFDLATMTKNGFDEMNERFTKIDRYMLLDIEQLKLRVDRIEKALLLSSK